MKKYINKINDIKRDLQYEYSCNREFSILNTKLEDLLIYFHAYSGKLILRGDQTNEKD